MATQLPTHLSKEAPPEVHGPTAGLDCLEPEHDGGGKLVVSRAVLLLHLHHVDGVPAALDALRVTGWRTGMECRRYQAPSKPTAQSATTFSTSRLTLPIPNSLSHFPTPRYTYPCYSCILSSLTTSLPTPFPFPALPPLLPHYKPSHSFPLPSPAPSPLSPQAFPLFSPPLPCPLSSQAAANLS